MHCTCTLMSLRVQKAAVLFAHPYVGRWWCCSHFCMSRATSMPRSGCVALVDVFSTRSNWRQWEIAAKIPLPLPLPPPPRPPPPPPLPFLTTMATLQPHLPSGDSPQMPQPVAAVSCPSSGAPAMPRRTAAPIAAAWCPQRLGERAERPRLRLVMMRRQLTPAHASQLLMRQSPPRPRGPAAPLLPAQDGT